MCIELDIVNGLIIVRQNHWPTDRRQEGRTYTINAYTKPLTDRQTAGRSDVYHQCLHRVTYGHWPNTIHPKIQILC